MLDYIFSMDLIPPGIRVVKRAAWQLAQQHF